MTAHTSAAELQQLSSFYRLLNQASGSKSEREIIRVFIEALAVWQDTESWGYFADVTGRFVLDVMLPGSDRSRVPATIETIQPEVEGVAPVRIAAAHLGAMGFQGVPDALVSRISVEGASEWLLVTEDPGHADAEARLAVYVQAVIQALNEINAIHSSRLIWAMLEHLLPSDESLAHAAQGAIEELEASVGATAWLSVALGDGTPMLAAGDLVSVLSRREPARTPSMLIVPLPVVEPYQAVMGIRRSGDRLLTGRDEHLLHLAASTMGTWVSGAAARLSAERERRGGPRSFDQILKQRIDVATARGEQVALIVISLGSEAASSDIVHECVAQVRRRIRPADMAGRVASGRIGVLLPDTPPDDARAVIERLQQTLDSSPIGAFKATISLSELATAIEDFAPEDHLPPPVDPGR